MTYLEPQKWELPPVPRNFWKDRDNRLNYILWLGEKLNFNSEEDWYSKLTTKLIKKNYGGGLLSNYYNDSKYELIKELYPNSKIHLWEYPPVPSSFWKDRDNRLDYILWLGEKLNFYSEDDWYKLKIQDLETSNGMGMLYGYYDYSKINMLKDLFPHIDWKEWLFDFTTSLFWDKKENRKKYMKWVGEKYKFSKKLDWYKISNKHFEDLPKGESFLIFYDSSPIKCVQENFPEIDWKEWLFHHPPKNFWSDFENIRRYLVWLGDHLGYEKPEDWYNVTQQDLRENRGTFFEKIGGHIGIILKVVPEYELEESKFYQGLKNQKNLLNKLKKLYPGQKVKWNHKSHLCFSSSGLPIEIDIFFPNLNIGFEYQGEQHYYPIPFFGGEEKFKKTKRRDSEKRSLCKKEGIKLYIVPYTWDGKLKSLKTLIELSDKEI